MRIAGARASGTDRGIAWGLGLAAVVAACLGLVVLAWLVAGTRDDWMDAIDRFDFQAAQHTDGPITYDMQPPAGGPHHPQWANCGFYSQQVPAELAVHSLEHGAVWVTYGLGVTDEVLGQLRVRSASNPYLLVSPDPGQAEPLVLTAWNNQMRMAQVDPEVVDRFISRFIVGPDAPEPGAPCWGGIGTPG